MVNSVTEKFQTFSTLNKYSTYASTTVQNTPVVTEHVENASGKKQKKEKLLLPLGLIAGGGILLYMGLKHPSPETLYNRFANSKIFGMDKRMSAFTTYVEHSMNEVSAGATKFIQDYKARRFVNPSDNLGPLRTLTDPRHLIDAQDIAFESILAADQAHFKVGATDFGDFSSTMFDLMRAAKQDLTREQNITKLDLDDFIQIPIEKNEKYSDLIEAVENRLINSVNFMKEKTGQIIDTHSLSTRKRLFVQMANAVLESRKRIKQAKMNIIDETYARMGKLLELDDLAPSYHTIPEATEFSRLTDKQLKPTKLPAKLRKAAPYNIYLKALQSKDFANLTDEDIHEIFYTAHYGNSLQDLGFLIDRLRIRQVVDKAKAPDKPSTYDVIVPKLEYLSKRLHEYGKRELFDVLSKDFDDMRVELKQSSVYHVMRVAKRLGYESIQEMDAAMMKENAAYPSLSIRKYIQIFKENPDLYFS